MNSENYYVVKKGHQTGIFSTWAECKKATEGYNKPIFRKFATFDEANEFLNSKIISINKYKPSPAATADTDKLTKHFAVTDNTSTNTQQRKIHLETIRNVKSAPFHLN